MPRILVITTFCLALLYASAVSNGQGPAKGRASATQSASGKNTFSSSCSACHGLDGRGGDKAPNIATSARVQHFSDAELSGIISNGVPGTGMPAFHSLTAKQVHDLVGYLRSLQGKVEAGTVSGNAQHGKEIFFGKGNCSDCHTISGQGGFLGPDLTNHAATSSAAAIRDEIVKAPRVPATGYRSAVLVTAASEKFEGLVRNEDNFSVQMQTKVGSFHFFKKASLQKIEYVDGSLMPSDYGQRLSNADLNDLTSYLMTTSDPSKVTPHRKDDFE
jgi:putative heme-binding domain-containing protein